MHSIRTHIDRRQSSFDRSRLPVPKTFYERELGKLSKPSRGWVQGRCPWHQSKSGLSFSVNLETGGFFCHGCEVSGGDAVDFVRLRDKTDFVTAAKSLGAWGDVTPERPATVPIRYLVMDFVIDGAPYRAEVRDEPKSDLERLRWIHHEAADRLKELRTGDNEEFENEESVQWEILSASWELIQMELGR